MKVLIVEDEIHSFKNLRKMLLDIDCNLEISGPVTNVGDLKDMLLRQDEFDAIFSDIRLDDGMCFEAFEYCKPRIPVIFTTAFDDYALQAFESHGIAYLLKPIDRDKLEEAVISLKRTRASSGNDLSTLLRELGFTSLKKYVSRLLVEKYDGAYVLQINDINHITKNGDKVIARLKNGKEERLLFDSLDEMEEILDPMIFFRANRQFIININHIEGIKTWFRQTQRVIMKDYPEAEINISKEKVPRFKQWLQQ